MRFITLLCIFWTSLLFADPLKVTVSVPPIKFVVEKIGRERVETSVVVPGGVSPHSYEPKGRQAVALSKTELFFCVGESFETRLSSHLRAVNPKIEIIDLRECIDPLPTCCNCHTQDIDPHLWLSPKQLKKIAVHVYEVLCRKDPEGAEIYRRNYYPLLKKIEEVDDFAMRNFSKLSSRTFVTAHAAFGYLARDYNLVQLALENNGRPATPKAIVDLIEEAKNEKVSTVFAQPQYNSKGAMRVAEEINAKIVFIDPYQEDVLSNSYDLIFALCPNAQ